ncbi:hypothetical protein E4U60_000601 [Claviceps pazoutovae]|uniref:Uncharacterized protein n=1 Tax=Claviceps pazoutovae TaxID=1649127 RepID=A0A9P7MDH9_9HYPO|nr:hypothetical protein E4U60_000601 [Claviceps pazoutovae]
MPKRHNSPITQVFLSPFSKPFVILSDYYESYDVLVHRTEEFDRASFHIDEFLPFMPDHRVAMMSSDPRLKANKERVKGLISPGILSSDVVPVIYEKARHLMDLWKTKMDAAQGRPFACHEMASTTSSFASHLQVWILKRTKWRKDFQTKEKFLSDEINKSVERLFAASSDSSRRKTVVHYLIERELAIAEKSGSRPNFHKPSIMDEAFGSFVTGSDTVSTSMGWAVKFLADNQTAQAKLRRQLHSSYRDAYDEKRQPDVSEIFHTSAPYLDAFIVESLRCRKTVPSLVRQATVDTEILGNHIPKGTTVFMGIGRSITERAMPVVEQARSPSSRAHSQRLPSWNDDDIAQFAPERWLKTSVDKTRTDAGEFDNVECDCNAGSVLSFGAGSRGCFGKSLAHLGGS